MSMVKASDVDFRYPAVGFSRTQGLVGYDDFQSMTRCHPGLIENGDLIGMEIIDNDRRRWIVRSVILKQPLAKRRWWHIFRSPPYPDFDLELEEAAPISLDDLKRRFLAEAEVEDPEDEKAVRAAPDLATMIEKSFMQCSGFLD